MKGPSQLCEQVPRAPPQPRLSVWATRSLTSQASAEVQAFPAPFSGMKGKLISEGTEAQERASFFSKTFVCDGLFFLGDLISKPL